MKKKKIIIPLLIGITIILLGIIIYTINNQNKNLVKLTYIELNEKIDNKEDFVLCISASECIHCNKYKPKLEEIANTYNIKIYYVNIDEFTDEEYKIFKTKFSFDGSTPITILFKAGEEKTTANRIAGNVKKEKIINKLKNNGFITE